MQRTGSRQFPRQGMYVHLYVSLPCGRPHSIDTEQPLRRWAACSLLPSPHYQLANHDPPHRCLHCRILCALVLRFKDLLRGTGSLETVRVSGSILLLQSSSF